MHGALVLGVAIAGERGGGKGGTFETVATSATTNDDDFQAWAHGFIDVFLADDSGGACVNEWIVDVGGIELDRAANGGNAHAVAVIAHAANDATHDAERVDDVFAFDRLRCGIGSAKAENIDVGDRIRAFSGTENVANYAADASIGSGIGLDGARVIVCFHLEADSFFVIETDKTSVVVEATEHEIGLFLHDALAGILDVGLE